MLQWKLYEQNGNDSLKLEKDVDKPTIQKPTDVLVKIHALSLNARDNQFSKGTYALKPPQGGVVVTSDAAGEVVEVGEGVNKYAVGDRVSPIPMPGYHHSTYADAEAQGKAIGFCRDGTATEFMVVDQEDLVKIPSHMSYEEASTLPIACGTAWNALYGKIAQVQSGDTVLCMGTGGVSLFTAAIALTAGAKVIVTSSSDKKLQAVKDHLAPLIPTPQAFQTINYATHKEWDQEVDRLTNGEKVDFLLDIAGSKTFPTSIKSTKRGGLISLVGILSNQKGDLAGDDIAQLLLFGGPIVQGITCCNREQAKKMHAAFELSEFRPVINKVFEFHQLKAAYDYSVAGDHFGKIVVKVAQ